MNKFVVTFATIFTTTLMLSSCEDGSYFNSNTLQMKSSHVSRLEATGEDLRVYEFSPQSDKNRVCIFVAGEQKAGLECFKIGE